MLDVNIYILYSIILISINNGLGQIQSNNKLIEIFSWKQIGYNIDGVKYTNDTSAERKPGSLIFQDDVDDSQKFFIQYNNVPIGMEVYGQVVFVTVPRRRYGIPSTLNYVQLGTSRSPLLRPYPDSDESKRLVSVYRPEVDACSRIWMIDTGLLEIPGARRQVQPPAILAYDLKSSALEFRYELDPRVLVNERTSGGLTSITVDVDRGNCGDAYAYINDLATEGMIVFHLKTKRFWRINHPSFVHDEASLNFTVAGNVINWKDGLFSIALSPPDIYNKRRAFYHPLVSKQEFSVGTQILKNGGMDFAKEFKVEGIRGPNTQSGSHAIHGPTKVMLYANVAQDAILCWNIDTPLTPSNVAIVAQDHEKLVYISDLIINGDNVWVLVNQIPRFVFSSFDTSVDNYFIHRGNVQELIRGTVCERA